MENQENNNINELEQLKAQYETLKQQFDQQEIVNDRLMKSAIQNSTDFYSRYYRRQLILYPVSALLGLGVIHMFQAGNLSLMLFWIAYCVVCFWAELWMTRKLRTKTLENNDLLTFSHQARSFKKLLAIFIVSYCGPLVILVLGILFYLHGYDRMSNMGPFILMSCLTLVIFGWVTVAEYLYKSKPCNEIIRQIEAPETVKEKKTGFDKSQKWFAIVMVVLFLGLDVWAYSIVASHLGQSSQTTTAYVRAEGDLSAEGSLEIWEVDNFTTVSDKAGYLDTVTLKDNDSLVYRWFADTSEALLFTLRKTTQTGPAVSSAVLGGKPLIKEVKREPAKEGESEMLLVTLTPEASVLFKRMTEDVLVRPNSEGGALVMDGNVYQHWQIRSPIDQGTFFIWTDPEWSDAQIADFCERLLRQ